MSFGGEPINAGTEEEAEELMLRNERESIIGNPIFSFVFKGCIIIVFLTSNTTNH